MRMVADHVYCVDGEWDQSPMKRRMTVIVLKNRDLILHSPIQMSDEGMMDLERMGRVA